MKIKSIFYLFFPAFILSACSGINIRIYPESIKENTDVSAILKYKATRCIPFISCSYNFSILGAYSWWELNDKVVELKPDRVTKEFVEFAGIHAMLSSPGKYVLNSIELKYGGYSYILTGKDGVNYSQASKENIQYENQLKCIYNRNQYSFFSYVSIEDTNSNCESNQKVPLRIAYDTGAYPDDCKKGGMHLPLPFSRIDLIDLYFADNIFNRPDPTLARKLLQNRFNRGISYAESQNYQSAINSFTEVIKAKSDFAEAYYARGYAYDESGSYQQAVEDYSKAIELHPGYAEAYFNRGNSFSHLNELQKAIENYSMAIKYKPDHANAYLNRGLLYNKLGNAELANKDCEKAIAIKPELQSKQ